MKLAQRPIKHAVLDNLLKTDDLLPIVADWPGPTASLHEMPTAARHLVYQLSMQDTLDDLATIFGHNLMPDPHILCRNQLWEAGFAERRNGYAGRMQISPNVHPLNVYRRVNLTIFLGDDWLPDWSGLHLRGLDGEVRIAPQFGRVVAFEASETAWHGFPAPLNCADDVSCKRLDLAYYSARGDSAPAHSRIYLGDHVDLDV